MSKLEMCPWDTDAPADAKFEYSHKVKNDIFLCGVKHCVLKFKFDKVLIKNTGFRDNTS